MIYRFLTYGMIGWLMEIIWTGLGSILRGEWRLVGQTYLWMLPIYGCGILLEPIHERIRPLPWFFRGLVWTSLIFGIEGGTGTLLKMIIGSCPWDYTGTPLAAWGGTIRLDYAPLWFGVCLGFEQLHDLLHRIRISL